MTKLTLNTTSDGVTQRASGFTLIELIFVVAIIGVMATIGLTMFQKQALTNKVDKAAMQMQQLAQSASAYFVDFGDWPELTEQGPDPIEFRNYLPLENVNNRFLDPWGGVYLARVDENQNKVWTLTANDLDKDTAIRVKGRLPFANLETESCDKNCILKMAVPIPGQYADQSNVIIKSVGNARIAFAQNIVFNGIIYDNVTNQPIQLPADCPNNYTPKLIHGLTGFTFGAVGEQYPNTGPALGAVSAYFNPAVNAFSSDMYWLKNTSRQSGWSTPWRDMSRILDISYITACVKNQS